MGSSNPVTPIDIKKILEQIPKPEVEQMEGKFLVQNRVHRYYIGTSKEQADFFAYVWRDMFMKISLKMAEIQMNLEEGQFLYFNTTPSVVEDMDSVALRLTSEVLISPRKNIVIPVFVYGEHTHMPIEWKCGYCGTAQSISRVDCVHCGAPRALTYAEVFVKRIAKDEQ